MVFSHILGTESGLLKVGRSRNRNAKGKGLVNLAAVGQGVYYSWKSTGIIYPPGNLLEIYKVPWKFCDLFRKFGRLSLTLATVLVFQSASVHNVSKMWTLRCTQ